MKRLSIAHHLYRAAGIAALAAGLLLGGQAFGQSRGLYSLEAGMAIGSVNTPDRETDAFGDLARTRSVNWTRLGSSLPAGLDVNLKNGLYLGAWGAGIKWGRNSTAGVAGADMAAQDNSMDLYAGYRSEISKKLWVDVGVQRYGSVAPSGLPGAGLSASSLNELYGAVTWGAFTAKYSRNLASLPGLELGSSSGAAGQYLDLSANFNLGNGYSLSPRVGKQDVFGGNPLAFTDYSLTLGKTFANGLALSVTALGTYAGQSLYLMPGTEFTSRLGLAAGLKYAF